MCDKLSEEHPIMRAARKVQREAGTIRSSCSTCGSEVRDKRRFVNPRDRCPDPWHNKVANAST